MTNIGTILTGMLHTHTKTKQNMNIIFNTSDTSSKIQTRRKNGQVITLPDNLEQDLQ